MHSTKHQNVSALATDRFACHMEAMMSDPKSGQRQPSGDEAEYQEGSSTDAPPRENRDVETDRDPKSGDGGEASP